jgi:hypothetical protein
MDLKEGISKLISEYGFRSLIQGPKDIVLGPFEADMDPFKLWGARRLR